MKNADRRHNRLVATAALAATLILLTISSASAAALVPYFVQPRTVQGSLDRAQVELIQRSGAGKPLTDLQKRVDGTSWKSWTVCYPCTKKQMMNLQNSFASARRLAPPAKTLQRR